MSLGLSRYSAKQMPVYRFKFMIPKFRIQTPAQLQRAVIRIRQPHADPQKFMADESHVESRIMGHERAVCDKLPEIRHNLFRHRFTDQHFGRDPVHLLRSPMNPLFHTDERMEFLADSVPSSTTAPISMIRSPRFVESPVVSTSTATNCPAVLESTGFQRHLLRFLAS